MKAFVVIFFSLMALASLFGCRHSPAEVTDAEYRVLSAYTTGKLVGEERVRQIVILNETVSGAETPEGMADLNNVPGLKTAHSQVCHAFLDANLHPSSFQRSFTLPVPYQIVASSEMHSIFGTPGDTWGRYYEKYPNSTGLLRLSRAGFNSNGNQDADVIFWLRQHGRGYQTRANALLRAAMLEDVNQRTS